VPSVPVKGSVLDWMDHLSVRETSKDDLMGGEVSSRTGVSVMPSRRPERN
jgi:hypothetical protein